MRLDPHGAPSRSHLLGRALYAAGRYEEAAQVYRRKSRLSCGNRAELAAALARAGHAAEAREAVAEMGEACKDFNGDAYVARLSYARHEDRASMREGMRAAGL
jgi:hypothetical protein